MSLRSKRRGAADFRLTSPRTSAPGPLLPQPPYDRRVAIEGSAAVHSDSGPRAILTNPAKERRTKALYVIACWTSYCARKIAFGIIP
jgi:hypothetical protein